MVKLRDGSRINMTELVNLEMPGPVILDFNSLLQYDTEATSPDDNYCARWTGNYSTYYYPIYKLEHPDVSDKPWVAANRLAYAIFVGPVFEGYVIKQICNHRWCLNENHLVQFGRNNVPVQFADEFKPGNARKLSDDAVHNIRNIAANTSKKNKTKMIKETAAFYNVTTGVIYSLLRGDTYKNV